jgi:hypothetical protein
LSPTCDDDSKILQIASSNPTTICLWPNMPGLTNSYTILCDGGESFSPQLHQFALLQCQGSSTAVSPTDASVPKVIGDGFNVFISPAFRQCHYIAEMDVYQYASVCSDGLSNGGGGGGGGGGRGANSGSSNGKGVGGTTTKTQTAIGVGVGVSLFVLLAATAGYFYWFYRVKRGGRAGGLAAQDESASRRPEKVEGVVMGHFTSPIPLVSLANEPFTTDSTQPRPPLPP